MSFDIADVRVLHLEPTSKCNAACPQCERYEHDGYTINKNIRITDLKLQTIKENLSLDFVRQLDKMFMCGNYGDPAAHKQAIQIYDWFREINPEITLGMNTNGSLRNTHFWNALGQRLNRERDYCVFSIDGLEDTNHLYRRNTNWNKIIINAIEFIKVGGRAHWDMLVFKHNEHQVDECMKLAKELGFVAFRAKVSKRFIKRPFYELQPPEIYKPTVQYNNKISCYALNEKTIFMNYSGQLLPCCWLSNTKFLLQDFPQIVNSWTTQNPVSNCVSSCSVNNDKTNFGQQWFREEYFV
ncbi:radical SAM protein [bacterium]|nr:radical SAM protein [bacterium]